MNLGGIKSNDESGRVIEGIVNNEICFKCGGKCCKRIGCAYYPDDFEDLTLEGLRRQIDKGYISIDIDAEESMNYYLRARNKYASVYDLNAGGICKALGEHGCIYDFDHRPTQGRLLVPLESTECKLSVRSPELGEQWEPYQETLKKLSKEYLDELKIRNRELANNKTLLNYLGSHFMLGISDRKALVGYRNAEPSAYSITYTLEETLNWLYTYKDFNILYDAVWHSCRDSIYTILEEMDKASLVTEDIYVRDIIAWIIYSV